MRLPAPLSEVMSPTTSIRPYGRPGDLVVKYGLEQDNATDLEIAAKQLSQDPMAFFDETQGLSLASRFSVVREYLTAR